MWWMDGDDHEDKRDEEAFVSKNTYLSVFSLMVPAANGE